MIFSSLTFIYLFLPVVFFGYWFIAKRGKYSISRAFLVVASLFFYGYYNPIYLPIILASMSINFYIGNNIAKPEFGNKREWLYAGIIFNLALLGYFKYVDFFLLNTNLIFGTEFDMLKIALPLGISFFTFQQISYLVDSYKGETGHYNFINYSLFVSFFPQLIAGPIVHHKEMMPQFDDKKKLTIDYRNILIGMFIFTVGFFKKTVVADTLAPVVRDGYASGALTFYQAWLTSLSYTFQLYFDFSGYCDMAIGIALMFNINLPANFNSPYKSRNIQEFWQRWHITLGRFLKDYIYIPLGGNRAGKGRTYLNLFLTFVLGGLWHGASWMFVLWGASHGAALALHRYFKTLKINLNKYLAIFMTFMFVNITWVFFRAENMTQAKNVLHGMFDFSNLGRLDEHNFKVLLGIAIATFFTRNSLSILKEDYTINKRKLFYYVIVFLYTLKMLVIQPYQEFIYFNF